MDTGRRDAAQEREENRWNWQTPRNIPADNKYTDPLILAQEVEVLYGKPYLNALIRTETNDKAYNPSLARKLLMELPWNDVFTTNYDTLLERAYEQNTKRNYKPVYNHGDLLYSGRESRIIKLHGSFPSYEPFIISENDFRRYPIEHSPFVNTVQQSLLENLFVLIGFSGDDPNFLKWIGWIHDNLGLKNSPRLYLVTYKAFSPAKEKMLAAKNIDVVVLDDISKYKSNSYKTSIEKFLGDLKGACEEYKEDLEVWPKYFLRFVSEKPEDIHENMKSIHV